MNTTCIAAALAALVCGSANAADPATEAPASASIGTWRLNVDESSPPQGRSIRPFTLTIRQSGEILDFTQTEAGTGGKIRSFSRRTPTDGVMRDVPDMPGARMAMTLLPSGIIDAKFRLTNETLQHKFCWHCQTERPEY